MLKVGISGVPSTGKSSLTHAVSNELRKFEKFRRVELISEYARTYIRKYGAIKSIWEQYKIVDIQREWEMHINPEHTDVLLSDSPIQLAFMYATELNDGSVKSQMVMSDIFKKISRYNSEYPYDIIFHLPHDGIEVRQDDVRMSTFCDHQWRQDADAFTRSLYRMFPAKNYVNVLETSMEDRVRHVVSVIMDQN